jgi:hypothetical protein
MTDDDLGFDVAHMVREAVRDISGDSTTFIDDNIRFLATLAIRAVLAGLHRDMRAPGMYEATTEASERHRAAVEGAFGWRIHECPVEPLPHSERAA